MAVSVPAHAPYSGRVRMSFEVGDTERHQVLFSFTKPTSTTTSSPKTPPEPAYGQGRRKLS
jgi:hypothetical protein